MAQAVTVTITTEVELSEDQIAKAFDKEMKDWCPICRNTRIKEYETICHECVKKAFDGWCPVCLDVPIDVGEIVCCECFKKALAYHINTCGCYP